MADELKRDGVGPGNPVMLVGFNSIEWIVSFWAIAQLGAIVALGNPWWVQRELLHAIDTLDCSHILAGDGIELGPSNSIRRIRLATVGELTPSTSATQSSVDPGENEHEAAVVVFTSGTTGPPKGVTLSHRAVIANLQSLLIRSRRLPEEIDDPGPQPVTLQTLPLFHMGGVQSMALGLVAGIRLVLIDGRFEPRAVGELIERERIQSWSCVPTMLSRVIDEPTLALWDVSSLRSLTIGGAMVPPELVRRARERFPSAETFPVPSQTHTDSASRFRTTHCFPGSLSAGIWSFRSASHIARSTGRRSTA